MSEEKFREWINSEFKKEEKALERHLKEREAAAPELSSVEMSEGSFWPWLSQRYSLLLQELG